jgi:protein-disulfide isomerase
MMTLKSIAYAAATVVVLLLPASVPAGAQSFSDPQRGEIEKIIKEYIVSHPEVLQEAMAELEKRQAAAEAEKSKTTIKNNAQTIFSSARQVTLGNPQGDVTLVEFFDYNCGYCKRALSDMMDLMKTDSKLKVVLKEFPVLGPGSEEAARVAVAVRMQDPTGKKYLEFHQKLLGGRGAAGRAVALDMSRLEKDMASDEAKVTFNENIKLAEALGMNGTPSYVVGSEVVVGAVGLDGLKQKVNTARCGAPTC